MSASLMCFIMEPWAQKALRAESWGIWLILRQMRIMLTYDFGGCSLPEELV